MWSLSSSEEEQEAAREDKQSSDHHDNDTENAYVRFQCINLQHNHAHAESQKEFLTEQVLVHDTHVIHSSNMHYTSHIVR